MWIFTSIATFYGSIKMFAHMVRGVCVAATAVLGYLIEKRQKKKLEEMNTAAKEAVNATTAKEKAESSCKLEVAMGRADCLDSDGTK